MATLTVDRISKKFDKVQALKELSFDCKEGEFVVIVGPSGAGKTTTLNCIAGIERPDFGSVYINERDVTGSRPQERNVAMVFETYALYPQLTVYDNLAFPLRSPRFRQPEAEIERRVQRVAETLSISQLLGRLPRQLSQGQRQRVSLGRALVREPDLFLFDEPISHLDAKLRNAMRRELKLMRNSLQQTTLYVTHDYLEALSLADRVLVLHKGERFQFDLTEEVYSRPAAIEVGQLFDTPPMMFFEGKVDPEGYFVGADGGFRINSAGAMGTLAPGQEVTLGLRPSDIKLTPQGRGTLDGEVYSVQNQFDQKIVTVESHRQLLDVIIPAGVSINEKDGVGIGIAPEICYYFDRATHKAL